MNWELVQQLSPQQLEDLVRLYQAAYWSRNRTLAEVHLCLQNSDLIIAFCHPDSKELVAFSRVLTDWVYRGFILDVIVAQNHQGEGLGRKLLETITNHPQLKKVENLILFCLPEMESFYQKWGFLDRSNRFKLMSTKSFE